MGEAIHVNRALSGTIIAFDHGARDTGVAAGQTITRTARGVTTLKCRQGQPDWRQVKQLIKEYAPVQLVVGLPLNMDGTPTTVAPQAQAFAAELKRRSQLPVAMQDERLTTRAAYEILLEGGDAVQAGSDHEIAACLILEDWLRAVSET